MKIYYQGKEVGLPAGVTCVAEMFKENLRIFPKHVIACKCNNEVKSLEYEIKEGDSVELLDLTSKDGMLVYIRGALFLACMAFNELYPNSQLSVNFQLSNAMFCELKNMELTDEMIDNVRNKMHEYVEKDLHITKKMMTKSEAKEFYDREKTLRGILQLSNDEKDTVTLYYCQDYYNYFYGVMPISTGFIDIFDIEKYKNLNDVEKQDYILSLSEKYVKIKQDFEDEAATRLTNLQNSEEYAAMTSEQKALAEVRVRTLLFNEYAWKYSGDTGSLTNDKLAGVLGFTITSEDNNHGSFVKDFTNGAREMYEAYKSGSKKLGQDIKSVVSDYGVHLMMLTNVYTPGSLVDIASKSDDTIVAELQNKYVSNLTTQTLYEYVYDLIKDKTVGDNGTFYTDYRNALVKKYTDEGKVEYKDKFSYEELNDLIK